MQRCVDVNAHNTHTNMETCHLDTLFNPVNFFPFVSKRVEFNAKSIKVVVSLQDTLKMDYISMPYLKLSLRLSNVYLLLDFFQNSKCLPVLCAFSQPYIQSNHLQNLMDQH